MCHWLCQCFRNRRLQKIRHYGILSRHSNTSIDEVREATLGSLRDVEPDLELEAWTVPSLRLTEDDGPKCPTCGGRLIFQSFQRIRPPPLNQRDTRPRRTPEHSF